MNLTELQSQIRRLQITAEDHQAQIDSIQSQLKPLLQQERYLLTRQQILSEVESNKNQSPSAVPANSNPEAPNP